MVPEKTEIVPVALPGEMSCFSHRSCGIDYNCMKVKIVSAVACLIIAAASVLTARISAPSIAGDYLEVRSCDVYTGPCFANAEMGLAGREGILVWSVRQGGWQGVALDGLSVIAVVRTDDTLGDLRYHPRTGKAVLIVDARATTPQREALIAFARAQAGRLIHEVADVKTSSIETAMGACAKAGCASVKAGKLVQITTRCFGEQDHVCGNEDTFYPPLTDVQGALPAYTELAAYTGTGLNLTWEATGQRSAFIARFVR